MPFRFALPIAILLAMLCASNAALLSFEDFNFPPWIEQRPTSLAFPGTKDKVFNIVHNFLDFFENIHQPPEVPTSSGRGVLQKFIGCLLPTAKPSSSNLCSEISLCEIASDDILPFLMIAKQWKLSWIQEWIKSEYASSKEVQKWKFFWERELLLTDPDSHSRCSAMVRSQLSWMELDILLPCAHCLFGPKFPFEEEAQLYYASKAFSLFYLPEGSWLQKLFWDTINRGCVLFFRMGESKFCALRQGFDDGEPKKPNGNVQAKEVEVVTADLGLAHLEKPEKVLHGYARAFYVFSSRGVIDEPNKFGAFNFALRHNVDLVWPLLEHWDSATPVVNMLREVALFVVKQHFENLDGDVDFGIFDTIFQNFAHVKIHIRNWLNHIRKQHSGLEQLPFHLEALVERYVPNDFDCDSDLKDWLAFHSIQFWSSTLRKGHDPNSIELAVIKRAASVALEKDSRFKDLSFLFNACFQLKNCPGFDDIFWKPFQRHQLIRASVIKHGHIRFFHHFNPSEAHELRVQTFIQAWHGNDNDVLCPSLRSEIYRHPAPFSEDLDWKISSTLSRTAQEDLTDDDRIFLKWNEVQQLKKKTKDVAMSDQPTLNADTVNQSMKTRQLFEMFTSRSIDYAIQF